MATATKTDKTAADKTVVTEVKLEVVKEPLKASTAATAASDAVKTPGKKGPAKGSPRPSAVLKISLDDTVDESKLDATIARRTQWDATLDELYTLTENGDVPRNDDGGLRFVRIGHYSTLQGAKAQIKSFRKRGLDSTFEFRVNGTDLYARVVETSAG